VRFFGRRTVKREFTPTLRRAHADERASTALFLASDETSFMTVFDMVVDGGVSTI
jgi:hypothetical protein